jgi:hypothetical protein
MYLQAMKGNALLLLMSLVVRKSRAAPLIVPA